MIHMPTVIVLASIILDISTHVLYICVRHEIRDYNSVWCEIIDYNRVIGAVYTLIVGGIICNFLFILFRVHGGV